MKPATTPFWKQPRGLLLLGLGGVLAAATLWLGFTRLGPSETASAEALPPSNRMDENALIAANAERPDAVAPAAAASNAIQASAEGKPGAEPGETAPESGERRFNPNEIIAEAEAAIDEAEAQADKIGEEVEAALDGDGK